MVFAEVVRERVVVLDGGLATELERRGNDLSSSLWSARLLRDDPAEIVAAHRTFFAAGAQVATTASYQAPLELLRHSVPLAREAADEAGGWVAASVGPYGAALADGSEYRGDYGLSVDALRAYHRPRLDQLVDAGPDVLAVETIPCLAEVEALVTELDAIGFPAWLSLTCDGTRTRAGEPVAEAFAMARDCAAVVAAGVNCTAPADVPALVELAAASGKPVVAYPNSGEAWVDRRWTGPAAFSTAEVDGWLAAGVRLVGGCCRVGPAEIAGIAETVR
ncbi:homocysteine S-methyltransferase [Fodinicola acaciae]|uniref:homocysteine S-methyltransferase n=1 Tax=Fodinicola acaciae TaxID=2681555 RepID=UPI0013D3754B|nr:homocysteine S-methyltransferase [Fodinicola acaciae]